MTGNILLSNNLTMKKLLVYLNSLSGPERAAFCAACGTSENYLRKAASINQQLGPILCVAIEKHSGEKVTRKDLNEKNWAQIWPELSVDYE